MSAHTESITINRLPTRDFLNDYHGNRYESARAEVYASNQAVPVVAEAVPASVVAGGPAWKQWNASNDKTTFNLVAMFPVKSFSAENPKLIARFDKYDILRALQGKVNSPEALEKVVVQQVQKMGANLPPGAFAMELYDQNGNALHTSIPVGGDSGDEVMVGFPLFANESFSNVMMRHEADINTLRQYGELSLDKITENVVRLEYPGKPGEDAIVYNFVPRENGAYFVWALEVVNKEVEGLLTDPVFQDPNHTGYFRIPEPMYQAVVKAYEEKLTTQVNFHNLSTITACLECLDPSALKNTTSEKAHILLEFSAIFSSDNLTSEGDQNQPIAQAPEISNYQDLIRRY